MNRSADFHAHGKLLLTGEYLVLAGAQALAIPLKRGQSMHVRPMDNDLLTWEARCPKGLWFSATFKLPSLTLQGATNDPLANRLKEILGEAFLAARKTLGKGVHVFTQLDFHPEYGFGSSATLISLLSQWLEFNAFELHHALFGGSGYDISCATAKGPILYSLKNREPQEIPVHFYPDFHDQLYFVYLGQKQRSDTEVARFKKNASFSPMHIDKITALTHEILKANSLTIMEDTLKEHEQLMSHILQRPTIQSERFKNYHGVVKSLGAWGGDFVLVTTQKTEAEFGKEMKERGFDIVYSFEQLVLR